MLKSATTERNRTRLLTRTVARSLEVNLVDCGVMMEDDSYVAKDMGRL